MSAPLKPRPPWWMFLFAASFLTYFSVMIYNDLWGPGSAGILANYDGGRMVVQKVLPGTVAEQARLMEGDHIISIDGQPIHQIVDWVSIRVNLEIGVQHRLQIERGHERMQVTIALSQEQPFGRWDRSTQINYLGRRGDQLLMLLLALVIAFSRPRDVAARFGAWFLASLSIANPLPPYGFAALWRHLPSPIGALLWIAILGALAASPVLFTFLAVFPRKLFQARWMWAAAWLPMVVCMPLVLGWFYHQVYQPQNLTNILPLWFVDALLLVVCAYLFAGVGILIFNYRRLQDQNQRRRLRVLVVGFGVGFLPFTLILIMSPYAPHLGMAFTPYFVTAGFSIFPLSFAYAILRHQLFDIRLIVRQGLQYAVARGVLLYMVPAAAGILVLDFYLHRDQTVGTLLAAHGWPYAAIGGAAALAHWKRQQWMAALDRRFFRERYNAQQLLRKTAEEIRAAASLDAVAPRVVARIEAALHPEFAALMVREARARSYRSLTITPGSAVLHDLGADSKLMAVFRALGKPLSVSLTESSWLKQQLPHADTEFLREARIDLMVPVSLAIGDREALLVLGHKKSEEPYSGEDQELLLAIANSLALLLERPAGTAVSSGLEECPRCGTCYDSGIGKCAQDGSQLTPSTLPRLLSSRYRLDRRLGRGGMGTVYSALDTSLERQVALKLIREDLVSSSEAAERFRREAKAAAAITHPNLVTLHDFVVDAANRAFLVMELLSGTTLRQQLQLGRLSCERMLEIVRGVCSALAVAHQRGLVHRDLKPENIFLARNDGRGVPKVLDFGLAKFVGSSDATTQATVDTGAGVLVGTLQYMSPEQLKGEPVSPHWDLWALAIITYEMLTTAYPFGSAVSVAALHNAILCGQFTPITAYLPQAPSKCQEFFDRRLSPETSRRLGSALEFLSDCERTFAVENDQAAS